MFTPLPNALPPPPQCPSFPLHPSTPATVPLSIPSTHPCGYNPMSVCPLHSGWELDVGWCVFVYKPCVLGGWKVVVVGTVFGGVGVIAGTRSGHRHACAHGCGHLVVGGERAGGRGGGSAGTECILGAQYKHPPPHTRPRRGLASARRPRTLSRRAGAGGRHRNGWRRLATTPWFVVMWPSAGPPTMCPPLSR